MKTFDELPIEIQNRMLDCQEEQGNPRNPDVFRKKINAEVAQGGFYWDVTTEGREVWIDVIKDGNYAPFFKLHPSKGWKKMEIERLREQLDEARKVIKGKQETIDKLCLSAQRTEANHQAYIAKIKAEKEAKPESKNEIMSDADFEKAKAGHPIEMVDGRSARLLCSDLKDERRNIIVAYKDFDGIEKSLQLSKDGFLQNLRLRTTKREGWAVFDVSSGLLTKKEAEERLLTFSEDSQKRLAVTHVTWEE